MKRKLSALAVAAALAYAGSLWAAEATITQSGDDNDASVVQTGADFFGLTTTANVSQTGTNNTANVTQDFLAGASAAVSQNGDGNQATIYQNNLVSASASITQTGTANIGNIQQKPDGAGHFSSGASATILQNGDRNEGRINQIGTNDCCQATANPATATIEQREKRILERLFAGAARPFDVAPEQA